MPRRFFNESSGGIPPPQECKNARCPGDSWANLAGVRGGCLPPKINPPARMQECKMPRGLLGESCGGKGWVSPPPRLIPPQECKNARCPGDSWPNLAGVRGGCLPRKINPPARMQECKMPRGLLAKSCGGGEITHPGKIVPIVYWASCILALLRGDYSSPRKICPRVPWASCILAILPGGGYSCRGEIPPQDLPKGPLGILHSCGGGYSCRGEIPPQDLPKSPLGILHSCILAGGTVHPPRKIRPRVPWASCILAFLRGDYSCRGEVRPPPQDLAQESPGHLAFLHSCGGINLAGETPTPHPRKIRPRVPWASCILAFLRGDYSCRGEIRPPPQYLARRLLGILRS